MAAWTDLSQGIYHATFGAPEALTPELARLKESTHGVLPLLTSEPFLFRETARGCRVEYTLGADEELFGFGLQLKSVCHKGGTKHLRVNADALSDSGDSHAPVPLVISSRGYGLLFSTLRNVSFRCGAGKSKHRSPLGNNKTTVNVEELYEKTRMDEDTILVADIPTAKGIEIYLFLADDIGGVVRLYNQYSGGGFLPPIWGLGPQFRCYARLTQSQVLETAKTLRRENIPCTMLGLEPGWQTHSYACSLDWDKAAYPQPEDMTRQLGELGFQLSLWEHAYISPESPLYQPLADCSGEYEVWKGLVPDLAGGGQPLFADYHRKEFTQKGILGFKLDECDSSDFTGGWSYPDCTEFPSGLDGEQMRHVFGQLYQRSVLQALGQERTFSLSRSGGTFSAPYPFALYSDLYGYADFIRGQISAGYAGLLWAPEVRDAESSDDFLRRLELAVFSGFTLINGWYLEEFPWLTYDLTDEVRALFSLRMSLIPYLYTAFYRYQAEGIPPIKGLPYAYGADRETHTVQDEYLFGEDLLVAPLAVGQMSRRVYLPQGQWYDFWTGAPCPSGWQEVSGDRIPVFVKGGTIFPFAAPMQTADASSVFVLHPVCYGDCAQSKCLLVDDDGHKVDAPVREIYLTAGGLSSPANRYQLASFHTPLDYFIRAKEQLHEEKT